MSGCANCGTFGVKIVDSYDEDLGGGNRRSVEYYTCDVCDRKGTLTIEDGPSGTNLHGTGVVAGWSNY